MSDFTNELKLTLASHGLACAPEGGRIMHKLIGAFFVAAFLPSALIALDLSVFRELRALQGLTMQQTLFPDLLASAFLVTVALVFVARSLARPIDELMAAMQHLKEGRLDVRAAVISNDELGILSERYNEILDGLRDREFIRETFGRYLPERVASTLLAQRGVLEPQLRTATVLFIDIERFTEIAERQAPASLFGMLNEYFSTVIERVTRAGSSTTPRATPCW